LIVIDLKREGKFIPNQDRSSSKSLLLTMPDSGLSALSKTKPSNNLPLINREDGVGERTQRVTAGGRREGKRYSSQVRH
jgi:hypothetical protein